MPIKDSLQTITKCVVPELKQRPAYQVGNVLYKTPRGAAGKVAWSWIMTKYGGYRGNKLENVLCVAGLDCECYDDQGYAFITDECPIHSRQSGYFRRLHRKCVSAIIISWGNTYFKFNSNSSKGDKS